MKSLDRMRKRERHQQEVYDTVRNGQTASGGTATKNGGSATQMAMLEFFVYKGEKTGKTILKSYADLAKENEDTVFGWLKSGQLTRALFLPDAADDKKKDVVTVGKQLDPLLAVALGDLLDADRKANGLPVFAVPAFDSNIDGHGLISLSEDIKWFLLGKLASDLGVEFNDGDNEPPENPAEPAPQPTPEPPQSAAPGFQQPAPGFYPPHPGWSFPPTAWPMPPYGPDQPPVQQPIPEPPAPPQSDAEPSAPVVPLTPAIHNKITGEVRLAVNEATRNLAAETADLVLQKLQAARNAEPTPTPTPGT